jgi:hypothetical protein
MGKFLCEIRTPFPSPTEIFLYGRLFIINIDSPVGTSERLLINLIPYASNP